MGILTHISGTTWTLEYQTNGATDIRAIIQRADGGPFHINNLTFISGIPPFFKVWKIEGQPCSAGFTMPDTTANNMEMVGWTDNVGSAFTWQFDFIDL